MMYRLNYLGLMLTGIVLLMPLLYAKSVQSADGGQSPNQAKVKKSDMQNSAFIGSDSHKGGSNCFPARFPDEFRTIDGTGNNCRYTNWGSAPVDLLRMTKVGYDDGIEDPYDNNRPNVREVSNIVADQGGQDVSYEYGIKYSDFVWQWGQFLDHDLDLTPGVDPVEKFNIDIPEGDPFFDPYGTGTEEMPLERSVYMEIDGVRQQMNLITAFIDASNVYGSDLERAEELRTFQKGYLKTSAGNLPPFNVNNLPNAFPGGDPAKFFLVGDFRGNEQVGLTAMHTLFVREHNRWADYFRKKDSSLNDEELYQRARAFVGAEMQHITYTEFLPLLLGKKAIGKYKGYKPHINPGISNVFATAAYRFGHSMVAPQLRRLNEEGESMGDLPLRNAFFNPAEITTHGIDGLLRGLASQVAQRFDAMVVDDIRNFLFGNPGQGGFDLASLNMQRGREHGIANYNDVRKAFKLSPVKKFRQINKDKKVWERLKAAYGNVQHIDAWIGGIAEKPVRGAVVGRTVLTILKDQFERLRSGDRFWYETYLPPELLRKVKNQTLAKIIKRNTNIGQELPRNVFVVR